MKTVTILGAAGRFGEACAKAFLEKGWRVRGVARGAKANALLTGVEPVIADAFDREALIKACDGSDVILHALNPASYAAWEENVLPLGRNVLAAAKASGATVLIPGNVYNFGTSIGMNMDDQAPVRPDTPKGRLRVELETMFEDAASEGVQTIVLRLGDFFGGARLGSWIDLMILKDLKKDKFVWPAAYDIHHAFAYLPDAAQALVALAENRESMTGFTALNFAGHTVTGAQMHTCAEQVVGRKLKKKQTPWALIRLIGLFNPVFKAVAEMSYLWRTPHSLNDDRLRGLIQVPHTPLADALRQTISDQKLDR